jgi:hypothetical protein
MIVGPEADSNKDYLPLYLNPDDKKLYLYAYSELLKAGFPVPILRSSKTRIPAATLIFEMGEFQLFHTFVGSVLSFRRDLEVIQPTLNPGATEEITRRFIDHSLNSLIEQRRHPAT